MSLDHISPDLSQLELNRRLTESVNAIIRGGGNKNEPVTLATGSLTTTLLDSRIGVDTVISLMPQTATASIVNYWITNIAPGSCVINHDSTADLDRTFKYTLSGS